MGDDHSRTWIFTGTAGGIDLRHDHRYPDGRAESNTFYGAFSTEPPLSVEPLSGERHEFKYDQRGVILGWAVEIVPGERYVYGTQRDGQWRHRFEFNLSTPVAAPPDPWGHPPVGTTPELPPAQQAFWDNLAAHCGNAYQGKLTVPPAYESDWRGDELLTVHFRECEPGQLRLPFHVDDNRSRTWLITRTTAGLDLRHDHRHEDGTPYIGRQTWYGAHTLTDGSAQRQEFVRGGRVHSGWAIEIVPGERYTYGLFRGDDWTFRVDFDLTTPVEPPPAPWGH